MASLVEKALMHAHTRCAITGTKKQLTNAFEAAGRGQEINRSSYQP